MKKGYVNIGKKRIQKLKKTLDQADVMSWDLDDNGNPIMPDSVADDIEEDDANDDYVFSNADDVVVED